MINDQIYFITILSLHYKHCNNNSLIQTIGNYWTWKKYISIQLFLFLSKKVSKKYSEMDEFYYRLVARYPNFPLPAMPRKTLFVGESDIRERRGAFDELMKAIAKHPTLATCSDLMEFLGKTQLHYDRGVAQSTKYGSAPFMWAWVAH